MTTGPIRSSVVVLMVLLVPSTAFAHFERVPTSTRAFSLGGAYVALADDPSAVVTNSAGLVQLRSPTFLASVSRPYEVFDLEEHFIAAALPTKFGTFGASWHRFGLSDVTAEDLFTLAYGRDLIRNSQDASLSVGASLDWARLSYESAYTDAANVFTGSVSVLLRPFPAIGVGYSLRNLGEPSLEVVAGSNGTRLRMTHALGVAWHWRRRAIFLYERFRVQAGTWRDALAVEMTAGDHLHVRGGFAEDDVTGGLGVTVSGLSVDVGVAAHEILGLSYHASIVVRRPPSTEVAP